jgi:hypothetical protein
MLGSFETKYLQVKMCPRNVMECYSHNMSVFKSRNLRGVGSIVCIEGQYICKPFEEDYLE